ncbi:NTP transferase domain-containing protein [Altererythrobacter aurantiacus]|uniref:Molybdenum cofactor guanylyltransferase n=1 Tax=Parapontixanthobacter aurantiacus TaxID=1463599 RepID=A0A844ZH20_9SPHN|nr:NTP transferase domain-containing protein [Parapontixanthobacter aurantiacus]
MKILGVVLAGGRSSRFGSDKAEASWHGGSLLDNAVTFLAPQVDEVRVAGREDAPVASLADWPAPGFGPLGGIAAALREACSRRFDAVLSIPVDAPMLPDDLSSTLQPGPSFLSELPVAGCWPVETLAPLEELMLSDRSKSVRAFAEACGARTVSLDRPIFNINTVDDLQRAHAFERETH